MTTTELEDRLRRALHAEAARAPLDSPTWAGPSYATPARRLARAWAVAAVAAGLAAVVAVGALVVLRGGNEGTEDPTVPVVSSVPDDRPRALPEELGEWTLVEVAERRAQQSPEGLPAVQVFERAGDGAAIRVLAPGQQGQAELRMLAEALTSADREPPDGGPSVTSSGGATGEPVPAIELPAFVWESGDGGGRLLTQDDGTWVQLLVEGLTEAEAEAVAGELTSGAGEPGSWPAPDGFSLVGALPGQPADGRTAIAALRSTADNRTVSVMTDAIAPGVTDVRLSPTAPLGTTRIRSDGVVTLEIIQRAPATPSWVSSAITWVQDGAQLTVVSSDLGIDDLRTFAETVELVDGERWQTVRAEYLATLRQLPETGRAEVGGATLVARGGDESWPEVLCLEAGGVDDCTKVPPTDGGPPVLVHSFEAGGWWLAGMVVGELGAGTAIRLDDQPVTLDRAITDGREWFAARLPDGATVVEGDIVLPDASGFGGSWVRP